MTLTSNASFRQGLAYVADRLQEIGALTPGLTRERTVDILWFYLGHQAWKLLVSDHGWTWHETEQWLSDQLIAAIPQAPEPS